MAQCELHVGRFTDDAQKRPLRREMQNVQQTPNTDAADLFVMGQRQLQRAGQVQVGGIEHAINSESDETLHVATAAPVNPTVALGGLKRWHGRARPATGTTSVWPESKIPG